MVRQSESAISERRMALIQLIHNNPLAVEEILEQFRPRVGRRTIYGDLDWLQETFPGHLCRERAAGLHGKHRVVYAWRGSSPLVLEKPITWLAEDELIGLVAARGVENSTKPQQDSDNKTAETTGWDYGPLDKLLNRAGVQDDAHIIERLVLSIGTTGIQQVEPVVLTRCLQATAHEKGLAFTYVNLSGGQSQVEALPKRVLLIKSEWYLIAWAGGLRMFSLSRMSACAVMQHGLPADAPGWIDQREVDSWLDAAFYATGSNDPQQRERVQLAVSPGAWPHLDKRRWGENQRIETDCDDLPAGWRRLSFTTTGLAACQHWVLSLGASVRVEAPQTLIDWLGEQAQAILQSYQNHKQETPHE